VNIPADLHYSSDHEWARVEASAVRVGITDFAQDNLGDVVFVGLPAVGRHVAAGESVSEVDSTKSLSEIYSPIAGVITEVNEALTSSPQLVNDDPYGEGWMFIVTPDNAADIDSLLDADAYSALIDG
jgi:glycine cleavage system H protein